MSEVWQIVFGGSSAANCDQCGARLPLHYQGCGRAQQYIQHAPWPVQLDAANAEIARLRARLAEAEELLRRWQRAHNKMDGKGGLTVAEFDAMRQDTHAFLSRAGEK